jgi:NAD(P)-dependent dehydrogenase (short-subunit alcohol dehydrogenase family)
MDWTAADIPDQTGRTALITGSSSGIGLEAAKVLAARGARVVLACRNRGKAEAAARQVIGDVELLDLDLASLASVREAAADVRARYERLDLLINNAGVMTPPYQRTADGFELQFGTNHLGHFAFTGLVLPQLLPVGGSRVVTVSSMGHRMGAIRFDDLNWERGYRRTSAYGMSKLANLLFGYELQRRLEAAGAPTLSVAAHPGVSRTELSRHLAGPLGLGQSVAGLFMQDAAMGALPTLRAATDPAVRGGEYYGPDGRLGWKGHPVRVASNARSHDTALQARLWEVSTELTGVDYAPLLEKYAGGHAGKIGREGPAGDGVEEGAGRWPSLRGADEGGDAERR